MDFLYNIIQGGIIGFIISFILFGLIAIFSKPKFCPRCNKKTRLRFPSNKKQKKNGQWTCSNCGCEIDKYGNEITIKN